MAVLFAAGALCTPASAVEFYDYGFELIDNSAGGSALDGYVTQQFWAETELAFTGAQLRVDLSQGEIFQDTFAGSHFTNGPPLAVLYEAQPSLEFDSYIEINGEPPKLIVGAAANMHTPGGHPLKFDHVAIDIAWSPGVGVLESGRFDLARVTLSEDAVGRGGLLLSSVYSSRPGGKTFIHTFEITNGTIRFTTGPMSFLGQVAHVTDDFEPSEIWRMQYDRYIKDWRIGKWISSYTKNSALPFEAASLELRQRDIALELQYLSDTTISELTRTGHWYAEGDLLIFSATRLIPEPGTLWLALLAGATAASWAVKRQRSIKRWVGPNQFQKCAVPTLEAASTIMAPARE